MCTHLLNNFDTTKFKITNHLLHSDYGILITQNGDNIHYNVEHLQLEMLSYVNKF